MVFNRHLAASPSAARGLATMSADRSRGPVVTNPWPLVLCLVGVDYFSTLAYLPSIAVAAAGPLAPVAAAGVVLVTFGLALPVYWYVVGRSPDGRGARACSGGQRISGGSLGLPGMLGRTCCSAAMPLGSSGPAIVSRS